MGPCFIGLGFSYDIDKYDERFLRHLALGYTKEMIANLKRMPFGVKSLEKRQNDLIGRLLRVRTSGSKCYAPCGACTGTAYLLILTNLEADERNKFRSPSNYEGIKWRMPHPATMPFLMTLGVIFLSWIFDASRFECASASTSQAKRYVYRVY